MKKLPILLFLLLSISINTAWAQITIAPTMVFVDQQNRFGSFLVLNNSDQPQEVSIEFPFGYPVTNKEGNIQMVYNDSSAAKNYGISNLVRGVPQNFVLQPGQRQVVRLRLRPKQFSDGVYWTRIKTTSNAQNPPIGEEGNDEVTVQINYEFEQVTTLFYKHGNTEAGIDIKEFDYQNSDKNIAFIADVSRTGNAPFLGTIILKLKDQQGNTVVEKRASTSIYFDYRQIFEIPKDDLKDGAYEAEIIFKTERPDIPKEDIVQMQPVSRSISFTKE